MALVKSLKKFFGLEKKPMQKEFEKVRREPRQRVGNRALPRDMQYDVMMAAQDKRDRKNKR